MVRQAPQAVRPGTDLLLCSAPLRRALGTPRRPARGPLASCASVTNGDVTSDPGRLHRLVVSCTDQPGIVAAVTTFLAERGANIVQSDQDSTDPLGGRFFLRSHLQLQIRLQSSNILFKRSPFTASFACHTRNLGPLFS